MIVYINISNLFLILRIPQDIVGKLATEGITMDLNEVTSTDDTEIVDEDDNKDKDATERQSTCEENGARRNPATRRVSRLTRPGVSYPTI